MNVHYAKPAVAVAAIFFAGSVAALDMENGKKTPRRERQRLRLLERFGDQGIDADADGTLTEDEIESFFQENPDLQPPCRDGLRFGRRGPWGRRGFGGPCDGRGLGGFGFRGPGGRLAATFDALDRLDPDSIPQGDTLERLLDRHPELDADNDGSVSADEWATLATQRRGDILARLLHRLPGIDVDGDGNIGDTELLAFREAEMERIRAHVRLRHPQADSDGDGVLSQAELDAFRADRQARRRACILDRHPEADVDGDGVLSDEELGEFFEDRPRRGPRRGFGGPRPWR